jgi:hypothetical protein
MERVHLRSECRFRGWSLAAGVENVSARGPGRDSGQADARSAE